MNMDDCKELSEQARIDGRRLFRVSESLYTILIIMNGVLGLLGGIFGFILISEYEFELVGLFVWGFTAFLCTTNYFIAVLSTHTTKVLAHTSLATVALMESRYESPAGNAEGGAQ